MKIWNVRYAAAWVCILLMCVSLRAVAARVSVVATGEGAKSALIQMPDGKEIPVEINPQGKGSVSIDITSPTYVALYFNNLSRTLLLTPKSDVVLTFAGDKFGESVKITGVDSKASAFINSGAVKGADIPDCQLPEKKFLAKCDSLLNANMKHLKGAMLPKGLAELESNRIKYVTYSNLGSFPYFHVRIAKDTLYEASPEYWRRLEELIGKNPANLGIKEYRTFLGEAAGKVAKQKYPDGHGVESLVKFIDNDIQQPEIAEFLVYRAATNHLNRFGMVDAQQYINAFEKYVNKPQFTEPFNVLRKKWEAVAPGQVSPDFKASNVEGKIFTLADFKGKYVYIDVWATWCGPCRKEIPFLEKLEEEFHGQDIEFVSISCDRDRGAWEKKVKSGMKGVQLWFEPGSTFMDKYMISSIPRFILLDKEGRIVSADMTRPSNTATAEKFRELLK